MKRRIAKQCTNIGAVEPLAAFHKENWMKNSYQIRTLWILVLFVVVTTCSALAAQGNYTCNLNLNVPPQGGLYSGTLVDPNGRAVGTCVGTPPLSPFVVQQLVPILCTPTTYYMDCSGASTLGALHNEALSAVLGTHVVPQSPPLNRQIPTVSSFVSHAAPWMRVSPAFRERHSEVDIALLTQQITQSLQAAGIVDEEGQFTQDALANTSRVIAYLQQSGKVSSAMVPILQRFAEGASASEVTKLLQQRVWTGNDRMAAAVISNIAISSEQYFGPPAATRQVKPGPGFWDAVGGLLTWELGPGSIIGGYLMSAASCGCFSF